MEPIKTCFKGNSVSRAALEKQQHNGEREDSTAGVVSTANITAINHELLFTHHSFPVGSINGC